MKGSVSDKEENAETIFIFDQVAKLYTLLQTKTAETPYCLRRTHLSGLHEGVLPPSLVPIMFTRKTCSKTEWKNTTDTNKARFFNNAEEDFNFR